jgi:ADP-heptose:LPS heptosyltransferase
MKILVIRFYHLGDTVLTSVLCNSLKNSFPDAQVDYLTYAPFEQLFKHNRSIDNVISISQEQRRNPIKYMLSAWKISTQKYDIIIDAQATSKSGFISLLSPSAEYRIGRYRKKSRGLTLTHRVPLEQVRGNKVQERLDLLQPLIDAGMTIEKCANLEIEVTNEEQQKMIVELQRNRVDLQRPVLVFCVSAKYTEKKWNLVEMTKLVEHCRDTHSAQILLFGALPHELEDVQLVYQSLNNKRDVFCQVKTNCLRDVPALFSLCNAYVGNEGGLRHIAQAVGIATASVFSPHANKSEWLPSSSKFHQAIEWRDVASNRQFAERKFEYGCDTYFKLYNNIKADDVARMADQVINLALSLNSPS